MTLPSPRHHWRFDDALGKQGTDYAGNAPLNIDHEVLRPGKWGSALRLDPDRTQGAHNVTITNCPDQPPPWTASMWIKREAAVDDAGTLLSSNHYALNLEQYAEKDEPRHKIGITHYDHVDMRSDCEVPLDVWAHLVFVGSPSDTRVYVDGELKHTFDRGIHLPLGWIGSRQGYQNYGAFLLDELKTFDSAFTAEQVMELYQQDSKPDQGPRLAYYWQFAEGAGTVATDSMQGATMTVESQSWRPLGWSTALHLGPTEGPGATTSYPDQPPPWAAAMWVRREAATEAATLLSSPDAALKLEQYDWTNTNRHKIGITRFGYRDVLSDIEAPIGAWVHLVFVGTATDTRLYVDGKLQKTFDEVINLPLGWVGSTRGLIEKGDFLLAELKIFQGALTDAQVEALHAKAPRPPV